MYSGGLDSTVLLHKLAAQSRVAGAIGFLYGQRHSKEMEFAKENCRKLNIDFYLADISALAPMFGNNSLTDRDVEVPEGKYYESNMKSTVVPNRNMIMLSLAAARAGAAGPRQHAALLCFGRFNIPPSPARRTRRSLRGGGLSGWAW